MSKLIRYITVSKGGQGEIVEKKSRFIATVRPVSSEEEALAFIAEMKKTYWDARHNCSAYIVGIDHPIMRCSDDGEPGQTAGRPMMDVLEGAGLRNVCVVVTRYFGGTLLGTGGLVHAYTESSKLALQKVVRHSRCACCVFKFTLDYSYYSAFENKCRDLMAKRPECDYYDRVDVKVWVRMEKKDEFVRRITDITERHARLVEYPQEYI